MQLVSPKNSENASTSTDTTSYTAIRSGEKNHKKKIRTKCLNPISRENLVNCQTPIYKYQIAAFSSATNIRSKADFCIHKTPIRGKLCFRYVQRLDASCKGRRHPQEKKPSVRPMSKTYKKKGHDGSSNGESCGCWDGSRGRCLYRLRSSSTPCHKGNRSLKPIW